MRLVKVAKALGMTGQELRHELEKVEFGVKPTDREVPDNLAQGIIRYVSREKGIEVDMEALGFAPEEGDDSRSEESKESEESEDSEDSEEVEEPTKSKESSEEGDQVSVLRKLTLEDVSPEAIKKQETAIKAQAKPGRKRKKADRSAAASEKKRGAAESKQEQIKKKEGTVTIPEQVTVKEFAEKTGVQVPKIIQVLMTNGVMATINQTIDFDTAAIVASEFGVDVQKEVGVASAAELITGNLDELIKDEPENLVSRPPVVVVMGHVDHGKTSILDAVRESDVAGGESGGITQHIGAYQVEHRSKGSDEVHKITFLDTPGHEAFTAMRARGAKVTDIAVIVVAAEEGIKPTTVEAIDHAKAAGVPILVAINKIDKEGADPDRVKGELAAHELQPEDWGGKTPIALCSAKTNQGIDDLLDSIVLMSEMEDLKANPNRSAVGTVIESHLDASLGPLATIIVNTGTFTIGDAFVCGNTSGKVRAMVDAHGERLTAVIPSGAVRVSGFDSLPETGDILQVVPSEQKARELLEAVKAEGARNQKRSFADLVSRLSEGKLKQLKIVLKADTQGSLDALQASLDKKTTNEVSVKVIHGAIGAVTESDVMMAAASDGIVIAFNIPVSTAVQQTAEHEGVKVRPYQVIYTLLDDIDGLLTGLIEPEEEEKIMGHLEIKGVFYTKKNVQVVGGKVTDGIIKRLPFRVMRDEKEVGTGRITSLKHLEKDIKEAKEGTECGSRIETSILIEEGDIFEVYLREFKKKQQ